MFLLTGFLSGDGVMKSVLLKLPLADGVAVVVADGSALSYARLVSDVFADLREAPLDLSLILERGVVGIDLDEKCHWSVSFYGFVGLVLGIGQNFGSKLRELLRSTLRADASQWNATGVVLPPTVAA
jgi:hypothetical protein